MSGELSLLMEAGPLAAAGGSGSGQIVRYVRSLSPCELEYDRLLPVKNNSRVVSLRLAEGVAEAGVITKLRYSLRVLRGELDLASLATTAVRTPPTPHLSTTRHRHHRLPPSTCTTPHLSLPERSIHSSPVLRSMPRR